ncbi:MAG: thioesterase family protein [Pseudomonadota bacterium]
MVDYPDPQRAAFRAFSQYQTRWRDNDAYGHMNNVVYYEYFDTVVNRWLIESGALEVPGGPIVGLVAETSCSFRASVGFPETVEIGLVASHVGRSSVIYGLGLFGNGEAAAAAVCRYVHVYVDSSTRKPVVLPDLLRKTLANIAAEIA